MGKWGFSERRAPGGQAPWPARVFCLAGVVEAPGSRAAEGRRAAIAQRPLTLEGRPRSVRGADRRAPCPGNPRRGVRVGR